MPPSAVATISAETLSSLPVIEDKHITGTTRVAVSGGSVGAVAFVTGFAQNRPGCSSDEVLLLDRASRDFERHGQPSNINARGELLEALRSSSLDLTRLGLPASNFLMLSTVGEGSSGRFWQGDGPTIYYRFMGGEQPEFGKSGEQDRLLTGWNLITPAIRGLLPSPDILRYHHKVERVGLTPSGLPVLIGKNTQSRERFAIRAELLGAADGGNSDLKRALVPDLLPEYTDPQITIVRGRVPLRTLVDRGLDASMFRDPAHPAQGIAASYLGPGYRFYLSCGLDKETEHQEPERMVSWQAYLNLPEESYGLVFGPKGKSLYQSGATLHPVANEQVLRRMFATEMQFPNGSTGPWLAPPFLKIVEATKHFYARAVREGRGEGHAVFLHGKAFLVCIGEAAGTLRPTTGLGTHNAYEGGLGAGAAIGQAFSAWEDTTPHVARWASADVARWGKLREAVNAVPPIGPIPDGLDQEIAAFLRDPIGAMTSGLGSAATFAPLG